MADGCAVTGDAGRCALVTGSSGGIGTAVVHDLERRGMSVVGLDRTGDGRTIACDVTDTESVEVAVAEAERLLGGLHVVVNLVGISGRSLGDGPVHECTDAAWQQLFDTNVRSVFTVCRYAVPRLRPGAAVVNMASVLGLTGDATGHFATHAYAATKGAIIALTRAMAATYAQDGIRVNAVAPGLVRTPMSERAQANDQVLAAAAARQRLTGPLVDATMVASAVGFLASTDSAAMTGAVLPVDGGWLTT